MIGIENQHLSVLSPDDLTQCSWKNQTSPPADTTIWVSLRPSVKKYLWQQVGVILLKLVRLLFFLFRPSLWRLSWKSKQHQQKLPLWPLHTSTLSQSHVQEEETWLRETARAPKPLLATETRWGETERATHWRSTGFTSHRKVWGPNSTRRQSRQLPRQETAQNCIWPLRFYSGRAQTSTVTRCDCAACLLQWAVSQQQNRSRCCQDAWVFHLLSRSWEASLPKCIVGVHVGLPQDIRSTHLKGLLSEYLQSDQVTSFRTEAKRGLQWFLCSTFPFPACIKAGDNLPQREGVAALASWELLQTSAPSPWLSGHILPLWVSEGLPERKGE